MRDTARSTRMLSFVRHHWPLWAALALFAALLLRMLLKVLAANDDTLVYALDDAYIHASIAKNFSQHGVWGVTQYAYTSSSSSPLWTLLLALSYVVTGVNTLAPFVLNVAASGLLLVAGYALLRRHDAPGWFIAGVLVLIVAAVPLNPYVFTGLEHVLHAALAVIFTGYGAACIARADAPAPLGREALLLYALGGLLASVRYEGLFLVAAVGGLLLLRGRFVLALALGALSVLPVVVYGLIAVSQGWLFLPASVVLKSEGSLDALRAIDTPGAALDWLAGVVTALFDAPFFAAAVVVALGIAGLALLRDRRLRALLSDEVAVMALAFALTTLAHLRLLTDTGLFERYTMYLVTLALLVVGAGMGRLLPRSLPDLRHSLRPQARRYAVPVLLAGVLAAGVIGVQLVERYSHIRERFPMLAATSNIYQQQVQMGRFLAAYYNEATVVANDIGAITFFTDIRLVDIFGLGTLDVARARIDGTYTPEVMGRIAAEHGAEIGIAYWHWITEMLVGEVPAGWTAVGAWGTPNVVVLGGETVTFYALTAEAVGPLVDHLWDFGASLPPVVFQQHYLLDSGALPR